MSFRCEGTYTALVTPFFSATNEAEKLIDWEAYDRLVHAQLDAGVTGLVPCGTTGESPTLDAEEQLALIARTVKLAKGRASVLAGTGSNSTRVSIALSRAAQSAGADAVMVVVPYYNKPTQEGLREHFVAIAAAVTCPVVVYNIPARTGIDLAVETLASINAAAPNVVATKEATGNVLRAQEILRLMGDRMTVFCGDDALTLPMIASGARGVISVTSNVYPASVAQVTRLALEGKFDEARKAHLALLGVHEVMFCEANPSPAKAALAHKFGISDAVRGPLVRVSDAARAKVLAAMSAYEATCR